MSYYDWETKWNKFIIDFASKCKNNSNSTWFSQFIQTTIISSDISISSMISFVSGFDLKNSNFDSNKFEKKIFKLKKKQVIDIIKFFLFDYISVIYNNPNNKKTLDEIKTTEEELEIIFFQSLSLNKKEIDLYYEIKDNKNTVMHSVLLLEKLKLGENSNNEALVDGIELIKEETYNHFDVKLIEAIKKQ